jgi:hypothetical protein
MSTFAVNWQGRLTFAVIVGSGLVALLAGGFVAARYLRAN